MDIKELIEKAFAVGHTIGYGNNENHYKPQFERWWNDEDTQEQVKNCSIPDVSESSLSETLKEALEEIAETLDSEEMNVNSREFRLWEIANTALKHT